MAVEQKEIDILKSGQLEGTYLLEINPKGQVRIPRLLQIIYPNHINNGDENT